MGLYKVPKDMNEMSVKRENQRVKIWGIGEGGAGALTRSEGQCSHLSLLHSYAIYQVQVPLKEYPTHTKKRGTARGWETWRTFFLQMDLFTLKEASRLAFQ